MTFYAVLVGIVEYLLFQCLKWILRRSNALNAMPTFPPSFTLLPIVFKDIDGLGSGIWIIDPRNIENAVALVDVG